MTKYEKYIYEMTEDRFITIMNLHCSVCPNYSCPLTANIFINVKDCVEELKSWCKKDEND